MPLSLLTRRVRLLVTVSCACAGLSANPPRPTSDATVPAYLLVALPSHQVIAERHQDILAIPIAPGSVMKVVTLAAALEQGVVDADTRIVCRRTIEVDGHPLTCAHPDFHRALDPVEALAHSCNGYFATIARRLPRTALDDMLVRVGLSPSNPSAPLVTAALGLGGVRATPRALLDAFCRLVGAGGTDVHLKDETRRVLRLGLELAAKTGTASAFAEAGYRGFAKTGTAPMPGGGSQGLVAAVVNTELPTHAIIVVAPGSTGAHAASLASDILLKHGVPRRVPAAVRSPGPSRLGPPTAPFTGSGSPKAYVTGQDSPQEQEATRAVTRAQPSGQRETGIRVGIARRTGGYDVVDLPMEDYVARAVAGEGGDLLPSVALEALAVTVRTYARANLERHRADGFDVCDLTHCLSLRVATDVARAAARSTAGLILTDRTGAAADVYLSAWCGGHTERPSRVWAGAVDHAYLPAQPDPTCGTDPGWVSEVTEPQMRRVLEAAGLRGSVVGDLRPGVRSTSGRVATLLVDGMWPGVVDGGAFRFAAGRILGWQTMKSTVFDVVRTGTGFRFMGKGSGHGVGLCVRGAAARARMGGTRDQILAAYFPGLLVGLHDSVPARAPPRRSGSWSPRSPGRGSSEATTPESPEGMTPRSTPQVRVVLPEADRPQLNAVRGMAERALAALAAELGVGLPSSIEIRFHPTVESYTRATGQPWWTSARATGSRIDLLPLGILAKRGLVETTLKHECVHVLTESTLAGRALWIREGLAAVLAGEFAQVTQKGLGELALGMGSVKPGNGAEREMARDVRSVRPAGDSGCPTDTDLRDATSSDAWRRAYEAAAACVSHALVSGQPWQDLR